MKVEQIKEILDLMREHELSEFELEEDGVRLRLRKKLARVGGTGGSRTPPRTTGLGDTTVAVTPSAPGTADAATAADLAVVTSPIVGTFYRAPDPSAPPFVEVGDTVKKGQVLCIIEAMKLMNEIDSEYDGHIVSVYVESGQAVQYGDRLFAIRPA